MSRFSSDRERRLWTWAAIVAAGIYATLGLARRLAGLLPDAVMGVGFGLGMLLVGAAVLTQGLRVRPRGLEIGVGLGVAAAYLLVALRLTIPAERSHLLEYSVVALLIYEALTERRRQGRRVPAPAALACAATADEPPTARAIRAPRAPPPAARRPSPGCTGPRGRTTRRRTSGGCPPGHGPR